MQPRAGVMQLGFVVADARAAAEHWIRQTGAGPFFVMTGVRFDGWSFRGAPQDVTLDIAFGQAGDVMIELIQPMGDWPNVYGDEPPAPGSARPHHHGYLVADPEGTAARDRLGPVVTSAQLSPVAGLRYHDCRSTLGLFVELITDHPETRAFFALSADAARDWDGVSDPIRTLPAPAS